MTEPLVVDLRGLLRGLHEHGVEYVLFGALGMVFYGFVRNTEDLDIVAAPDEENLNRVSEWLMSADPVLKLNPQRRFGPRERWGMHKGSNATVLTPLGQIDVVQRITGMPDPGPRRHRGHRAARRTLRSSLPSGQQALGP